MLKIKKISDVVGKKVYTDGGDFFGEVEEVNLFNNKIDSWRIRVGGGISNLFSGARGVIIPHSYVKSIGDVFVISQIAIPSKQELPDFQPAEN
ncbi:MAG: PRC-barrel domain-containing protein [Candidatus Pacearchaeota archaeon]